MKLIQSATKTLRLKVTHRRFRFIGKVKKFNILYLVKLSDFVAFWQHIAIQKLNLFLLIFGSAGIKRNLTN